MATPRYRVIDTKGAYMPRDPTPHRLQLGDNFESAAVYDVRAPTYELLRQGEEIEYSGEPGPHLEPLNDAARENMDAYWAAHPNATLDPMRHMPLGQDPMGGKTIEQLIGGLLEGMDREATRDAPAGGVDSPALLLAAQTLADGQAAMLAAVKAQAESAALMQAALTALLVHAANPPMRAGKAA
jgi:hypothetical protein